MSTPGTQCRPAHLLLQRAAVTAACVLMVAARGSAQVSTKIASVSPDFAVANAPITISADLIQGETVDHVYLVYRPFGESEYQRADMDLVGNTATVTLPSAVVVPPRIEYYIVLQLRTGTLETYPLSESADPFTTPPSRTLSLPVRTQAEGDEQILFLSPEPFSIVAPDQVLISVSLLRADSTVVRKATQIFLDGTDVTQFAVYSDDILVLAPENLGRALAPGPHRVSVRLYDRTGSMSSAATLSFTVEGGEGFTYKEPVTNEFKYGASVNMESRHEEVNTVGTWYNRAGVNLSGSTGDWRFLSNVYLTSEESPDLQPQNRYFIGVEHPLLHAGYGDSYPSFPNLIFSGKRIRGLNAGVHLGLFNIDVAYGQTTRSVQGKLLSEFPRDSLASQQQANPTGAFGPVDSATWGRFAYGTFAKNLLAVRPSFGSTESFQWGFTVLKAKDDIGSIRYGLRPDENLVIGTDIISHFDHRRIEFLAQAAISAYNSDISSGNFTDAYIDTSQLTRNDAENIKRLKNIIKNFITVNENLRPLSLNKLSTLAYDLSLSMNYFGNLFRFSYMLRGNDYNSAGQTFLRKDIRGFNISDRLRLLQNRLFLTLGLESLQDNTADTKVATTTYSTITGAVSYYPSADAPNITVGVSHFGNENPLSVDGPDSLSVIHDNTTQIFLQSSYDFTFGGRHTALVSFSTASKEDNSIYRANVKNATIGLGLMSRFAIPLQTNVDLAMYFNSLPTGVRGISKDLNYTTISLRGRYIIIADILNATAAVSPTFGDFKRTVLGVGAEYYVMPRMSFALDFSFFQNAGAQNDNFISLRYKYDI